MKRLVILLLLFLSYSHTSADEMLALKILRLDTHLSNVFRTLYGCPKEGEMTSETCRPSLGRMDYAEFLRARKTAVDLFRFNKCETHGLPTPDSLQ